MRPAGLHTHDHGPDPAVIAWCLVIAAAAAVVEWVLRNLWWLATAAGVILAALVTAAAWWMRGAPGRRAGFAAAIAAQREASVRCEAAEAFPYPPPRRELAGDTHIHLHFERGDPEAARVIRQALPGHVGDAITEED